MAENSEIHVHLISGTDESMISAAAAKIVKQETGEDPDPFTLDIVRERDGTAPVEVINEVIRSVRSPPFLGARKTVWLQNYTRFDREGNKTSKSPEAMALRELARVIREGIPADILLVLSGPGIDARKALATACKARGKVTTCKKPDVRDRDWERTMRTLVEEKAREKGVRLHSSVCSYLVDALGTDTARIDSELEKLICFCGGTDSEITVRAAEAVCSGQGEKASWALANALGERTLPDLLRVTDALLRQAKDPERTARSLLTQAGNCVRQLLQTRVLMAEKGMRRAHAIGPFLEGMDAEAKQGWMANGIEVVEFHPYRARRLAEQSLNYTGQELIRAVRTFRDAYWKCMRSSATARLVLEEALIRTVSGSTTGRS